MEEKLAKLALARRRTSSYYPIEEYIYENIFCNTISRCEAEDKKNGLFPYNSNTVQRITEFYEGKDILITGGTGFVGKVLIEKILRSIPNGGRLFLLLRGRKGVNPQERIRAMLKLPLFELLMTENPKAAERLVAIEGDCGSLGLGLSQADRQTIINNVTIVFHCAATVRFNLPFSFVVLVNTRGTREIVYLCKDLKKLDAFVHVSTAFSCATDNRTTPIPEAVLPSGMDWRHAIRAAENSVQCSHSDGFDLIFEKLQPHQGTNYTFSKLLSENLVEEECKGLPAVIVRPSVLTATYEDPFGGWVDNVYGPMSLWDGVGSGVVRTHLGDSDLALDYLPVDFNVKTLICSAWHRGVGFRMRSDPEKVDVVNNSTSGMIKNTFRMQMRKMNYLYDNATRKFIFRYPSVHITKNYWMFWLITMTSHLPLGILIDTLLKLSGKEPLLLSIYRRIFIAQTRYLSFFSCREFSFEDKWPATIDARILKEEKDRFSWCTKYFPLAYETDNVRGVIKHVFKETPVKREQSNRQIMYIVDWIHTALLVGLGLWILLWVTSR